MDAPLEHPLEAIGSPNVELRGREIKAGLPPPDPEAMLKEINEIGNRLRELIVMSKRLPKRPELEPHQDASKCIAMAQSNLQTGFMWMRRIIEAPKVF